MDRYLKHIDIACIALFGTLGVVTLVAGFCGKPHQFAMAAICAAMVAGAVIEIRREERISGREFCLRVRTIRKQLAAAILRRSYPAASIPIKYWEWCWDSHGNVKYKHWTTLWKYITASTKWVEPPTSQPDKRDRRRPYINVP